ncbi:Tfp pilus assembly protein PilX [Caldicoprobacter guelmensis]|uniref:pilus assembly PilX N-terminal domain-containing protein n=1 Tax=Caldicoprobacter guelmensis TaxID=1170224 RepID=UPI00195D66AC|nr:pilus assembly PilX N-terminal domain-containing protein [Caldicoprobacter guelmensis]MBM7581271.1 Tfp pilus assembly protein PilX [Caldicoprobacter guelmensis]
MLSVLILMIVFTLGTGLLAVTTSNYIMDQAEHDYQAAFYAAEAGLRHQMEAMKAEMDRLCQAGSYTNASAFFNDFWGRIQKNITLNLDMINNKPVKAVITTSRVTLGNDFQEYKIVSVGSVGNIKRTVESKVSIRYTSTMGDTASLAELFSYVIFVDGKINQKSNASRIEGNIGTNGTSGDVRVSNHSGNVETNCGLVLPNIIFPSFEKPDESLIVNQNLTIAVPGNIRYSRIIVDKGKTLTIQLDGDTIVYTDTLEIENGANIKLQGEGRLILYIKNTFVMDGGLNKGGDPNELIVFYDGETIGGAKSKFDFYGGLYAPKLTFNVSGQVDIRGSVVVKEIEITGNGNIVFNKVYDEANPITIGGVGTGSIGYGFDIISYNEL